MAAPMVSGAAALMIEQAVAQIPAVVLSPDTIQARLKKTAARLPLIGYQITVDSTTYNLQNDIFTVGAGSLDIQKALTNADKFADGLRALTPVVYYDMVTKRFRPDSSTGISGTNGVWGDSELGETALCGSTTEFGGTAHRPATQQYGETPRFGVMALSRARRQPSLSNQWRKLTTLDRNGQPVHKLR